MIDKSIFKNKKLYYDYFDDVKQFISDNIDIGNKIVIPDDNTDILLGFDSHMKEFFIYNIK